MEEKDKVKITKLGSKETPKKTPLTASNTAFPPVNSPSLTAGSSRKTFPKGILKTAKIKPIRDPAKHPKLKKFMKKHTIRLFTDSGNHHRKKTIKQKIGKMSDPKVKQLVVNSGLSKGVAPPKVLREILEGAMIAGFVSSG
jgi:hypothetical protein